MDGYLKHLLSTLKTKHLKKEKKYNLKNWYN